MFERGRCIRQDRVKKTIHSRSHQQGHGRRLFTAGHTSKDMEEDYSQQVTPARTWKKTIHSRSHQQGHGRRLFTAGHTSKDMEEDYSQQVTPARTWKKTIHSRSHQQGHGRRRCKRCVCIICTSRDIFSDDWESSR